MKFELMGLDARILEAVAAAGYHEATDVQSRAVPQAIAGHDLLVSSQTGSGKTAAFMLPALHLLATEPAASAPRILVLTPTRELSMQVTKAAAMYGRRLRGIRTVSLVGGMPYPVQNRLLRQGADMLVATPGRLRDQMQAGRVDLSQLRMLVLDEADRMLDLGFRDDIEAIVTQTPAARQTMLFSATLDGGIARMAQSMLKDPVRIEVASAQARHASIVQRLHFADDLNHKNRLLDHLLRDTAMNQAIVFTATKRAADDLAANLNKQGFAAAALHGDMHQGARNRTLQALRRGGVRVLVATDVAARGIDVQGISHVINYDLPRQAEDYVHRIGRTGRAGRSGVAISLASVRERFQLKQIERYTAQRIPVATIAGLEPAHRVPQRAAQHRTGSPPRSGSGWKSATQGAGARAHGLRRAN